MGAGIRVARRASARNVEFWQRNRCCAFLSSYGPTGELTHLDLPKPKRQTNELDRPDRPQRRTLLHICYMKGNSACDKYRATSTLAVVRAEPE
jgi:hypothetical protein